MLSASSFSLTPLQSSDPIWHCGSERAGPNGSNRSLYARRRYKRSCLDRIIGYEAMLAGCFAQPGGDADADPTPGGTVPRTW